jgi:ribosomal protein S12 methylthiotransferase accessory factor
MMQFIDLLLPNTKIALASGVCQFRGIDGSLFIKNDNFLYKISAESNVEEQSKLFRLLQKPIKCKEIFTSLSEFKYKDVLNSLAALYELNLITLQSSINKIPSKGPFINGYLPLEYFGKKTKKISSKVQLILIGNGVLADQLNFKFRKMNIKVKRVKALRGLFKYSIEEHIQTQHVRQRNRPKPRLAPFSSTFEEVIDDADLAIVAQDFPNILLFEKVNELFFKKRKAWMRVSFDGKLGYLGPLVVPGKSACFNCCELRLVTNSPNYEYELWRNKENIPVTNLNVPEIFADILSTICISEVLRYLGREDKPTVVDRLILFDGGMMNLTKHRVISHPNCLLCNPPLQKKSSADVILNLNNRPTKNPLLPFNKQYSKKSLTDNDLVKTLRELIDERTGIILEYERLFENLIVGSSHHFSTATCSRPLRINLKGNLNRPVNAENNLISPSPSGSGISAKEAEIRTLMESIERYSNMVVDESDIIWASYSEIQKKAINPSDLGLYVEEQYIRNYLSCSKFSVDSRIPWIIGHSLSSGNDVFVPADFVFYPAIRNRPLVLETSNGASSHTDVVQAVLNGLLEIIERDSFLTMWLNKISMPILNIRKIPIDVREPMNIIRRLGMDVKLVDLTNDTQIPTIMAACYNMKRNSYPSLIVGSGSHLEPKRALIKAVLEMELGLFEALQNPNKEKINDPSKIHSIHENSRYYLHPNTHNSWEFMLSSKKISKMDFISPGVPADNYANLMQIGKRLKSMNHSVVWVDITPIDMRKIGFRTVKVFVTGFQPMYVGNKIRLNVERLQSSARKQGYKIKQANYLSQLNYAPHPLP